MTNYVGMSGNVYARQEITSSATAQTTAIATYRGTAGHKPKYAFVQCSANPIRYTRDGTTPVDATPIGQLLPINTPLILIGEAQIKAFQFVQNTGAGTVHIEYVE